MDIPLIAPIDERSVDAAVRARNVASLVAPPLALLACILAPTPGSAQQANRCASCSSTASRRIWRRSPASPPVAGVPAQRRHGRRVLPGVSRSRPVPRLRPDSSATRDKYRGFHRRHRHDQGCRAATARKTFATCFPTSRSCSLTNVSQIDGPVPATASPAVHEVSLRRDARPQRSGFSRMPSRSRSSGASAGSTRLSWRRPSARWRSFTTSERDHAARPFVSALLEHWQTFPRTIAGHQPGRTSGPAVHSRQLISEMSRVSSAPVYGYMRPASEGLVGSAVALPVDKDRRGCSHHAGGSARRRPPAGAGLRPGPGG